MAAPAVLMLEVGIDELVACWAVAIEGIVDGGRNAFVLFVTAIVMHCGVI